MANEGALITSAATLLAALAFFLASRATVPSRSGRQTRDISLFFGISTTFLVLSGLRQVFAYAGLFPVDKALFQALVVPAAFAVAPLAHVTSRILGIPVNQRRFIVATFVLLVLSGMFAFYRGGLSGPVMSFWGSEWTMDSAYARGVLVGVVVLPALVAGLLVHQAGRHLQCDHGERLRRVGLAILVYYVVFLIDALGLPGIFLIIERLIQAATAWYVYRAYSTAEDSKPLTSPARS